MGKLIELHKFRKKFETDQGRERARNLVCEAALILSALGERDRRIGWILEDCVDLLRNTDDQEVVSSTVTG